jgi:hypothetical protein
MIMKKPISIDKTAAQGRVPAGSGAASVAVRVGLTASLMAGSFRGWKALVMVSNAQPIVSAGYVGTTRSADV